MLSQRWVETFVGLFLLFACTALIVLALKVSGLTSLFPDKTYTVTAAFDDIGGLKVRAPIKMSGVQIGEVSQINLDRSTFKAIVTMHIYDKFRDIPDDSSAGIYTAGLLGDNYIALTPMYSSNYLKDGSEIEITRSAMILEKLIGQFMYKISNSGDSKSTNSNGSGEKNAQQ